MAAQGEVNVDYGNAELLHLGRSLLLDFVFERLRRSGVSEAVLNSSQLYETEVSDPKLLKVRQCLLQFGDELDNNTWLKEMINCPEIQPTKEVFCNIAHVILSDKTFNWGRVVALFYLACELIRKAIPNPDTTSKIIDWTVDLMHDRVISWVREQGGWVAIYARLMMPSWMTVTAVLAAVFIAALILHKL